MVCNWWFYCWCYLILVLGCYFLNEDLFVNIFGTDLYYRFDRILDWQNGSGLQLEML